MLDMGGAAAEQVPIIDEQARTLLSSVSDFASGTSAKSIMAIQTMALTFKVSSAQAVADVLENLGKIPKDIYTYHHIVTLHEGAGGGGGTTPEPRQSGGPVTAGRPYLVGEEGPEVFVPRVSGTIVPRLGGDINVYVQGSVVTEQELASTIREILLRRGVASGGAGLA